MTWSPLRLKELVFYGPGKPPASLTFATGLNVICGASETGKSFVVDALDFMLGSSGPLRDVDERVGYDRAGLTIEMSDHAPYSFRRSVAGGDFLRFEGEEQENRSDDDGTTLKAKHAHEDENTLSGWLLKSIGLSGRRLRKDRQGKSRSLSFRDLVRLAIVKEEDIIKPDSPFWTGQYANKTAEHSALKLLLTGVDDSALVAGPDHAGPQTKVTAQIELIDQWLDDLRNETAGLGVGRTEIETQLNGIEEAIGAQQLTLREMQSDLKIAMEERRAVHNDLDRVSGRVVEIEELLARFDLLAHHYKIDLERLTAIEESGSLFVHQEKVSCPLCGATPDAQHVDATCEGNVDDVVTAARTERHKIVRLAEELGQTINDLRIEHERLAVERSQLREKHDLISVGIRASIAPTFGEAQTRFSELIDKRSEIRRLAELFNRQDKLEDQKTRLSTAVAPAERSEGVYTDLSKSVLGDFSKKVEDILKAWHFPGSNGVYFDEKAIDFVIDNKARGSQGKGLRAITHAAASIALMEYCQEKRLPHPGFVVLDSPLLAYYEPEGNEDDLKGTDLKDRFYEYLTAKEDCGQVIVIENEPPATSIPGTISTTIFTKNPHQGRYGFFPIASN
ncbi:MAG: hypothetical protein AB1646_19675 [Thermodesulfobacteriota bacterium]